MFTGCLREIDRILDKSKQYSFQMTEYSSDDDDRRTGRSSSDLTPDDFDFDIGNYSASTQNTFFSRSVLMAETVSSSMTVIFSFRPPESKKTERQRSKNDSRQGGSSKVVTIAAEIATNTHLQASKDAKMSAGSGASGQSTDAAKILCRICGDSAVRHVHYGGHCCFSCKAFFRQVANISHY